MMGLRLAYLLAWVVLALAPGKAHSEGKEGLDSRMRCLIVAAVLDAKFDSGKQEYFAPASAQKCALVNGTRMGLYWSIRSSRLSGSSFRRTKPSGAVARIVTKGRINIPTGRRSPVGMLSLAAVTA
jgi:hypothetical protein